MKSNLQDTQERRELRNWLAARLKMDDVPEPLWNLLEENESVDQVLDPTQNLDRDEFLGLAEEWIRFVTEMSQFVGGNSKVTPHNRKQDSRVITAGSRHDRGSIPVVDPFLDQLGQALEGMITAGLSPEDFTKPENMHLVHDLLERRQKLKEAQESYKNDPLIRRAGAFSLYLAKLAHEEPIVKNFRQHVWIDGVLSREQAEAVLYSPAVAVFSFSWFEERNVPIVDHDAQVLELERIDSKSPRRLRGKVRIRWSGDEVTAPFEGVALASDQFDRGKVGSERVTALHGAVSAHLQETTSHLRAKFPWPPPYDDVFAVEMFVLMGKTPWVEPIKVTLPSGFSNDYNTVNISVWPWVPVEEVTAYYDRARKELDPRPNTSPRRLSLFMFILRQSDVNVSTEGDAVSIPSWRKLQQAWNSQYPPQHNWRYADIRNFRRDFNQAFDQVVNFCKTGNRLDLQEEDFDF